MINVEGQLTQITLRLELIEQRLDKLIFMIASFRDWNGWRDGRPDSAVVYLIAKHPTLYEDLSTLRLPLDSRHRRIDIRMERDNPVEADYLEDPLYMGFLYSASPVLVVSDYANTPPSANRPTLEPVPTE